MSANLNDLDQGYPITQQGQTASDYLISLYRVIQDALATTQVTQYLQEILSGGQTIVAVNPADANFAQFVLRSGGSNTVLVLDDYTINSADQITLATPATAGDKLYVFHIPITITDNL